MIMCAVLIRKFKQSHVRLHNLPLQEMPKQHMASFGIFIFYLPHQQLSIIITFSVIILIILGVAIYQRKYTARSFLQNYCPCPQQVVYDRWVFLYL